MGRLPRTGLMVVLVALAFSRCTCEEPDPLPPVTEPAVARAPEPVEPVEPEPAEPEPAEPTEPAEPIAAPAPVEPPAATPASSGLARAPAAPAEPEPEVEFAWHQPRDGVFTPFANIVVTGEAEPGTWLKIRNGPELEVTTNQFEIPLTLEEGKNNIHLIVTEVGKKTIQHRRTVTFVDLDRIQRIRERISAHRKTVGELEEIRSDLVTTIADIRKVVPSLPPEVGTEVRQLVDELDGELANLGETSSGLDGDINRELAHIDDLERRVGENEVE